MKQVNIVPLPEHGVDKAQCQLLFLVRCDEMLDHEEASGASSALPPVGAECGEGSGRIISSYSAHLPEGSDGRFWILTLYYKIPTVKA